MNWNRDGRKKELWEKDKTWLQRKMINLKLAVMRYNRQTHGLGGIFILMVIVLIGYLTVTTILRFIPEESNAELERMEKLIACMKFDTCFWSV